jgi:hypothetical protein
MTYRMLHLAARESLYRCSVALVRDARPSSVVASQDMTAPQHKCFNTTADQHSAKTEPTRKPPSFDGESI